MIWNWSLLLSLITPIENLLQTTFGKICSWFWSYWSYLNEVISNPLLGIIHKSRDGGEEGRRFLEPTKCDFDIFPLFFLWFTNEFSCICSGFSKPNSIHRSTHISMNHEIVLTSTHLLLILLSVIDGLDFLNCRRQ